MKKLLIVLIIIIITGCSSYIELNDLAIINSIGIQKDDNNYKISISLLNEVDKDTLEPSLRLIEINNTNLNLAFEELSLNLNKQIYLSHLNLLVIDDSIKNMEIKEIINYFLNNQDARENFLIVFSNKIEEILTNSKFQEINNLVKINQETTSKVIYTTMYDLIKNYYDTKSFYLTNIGYNDNLFAKGIIKFSNNNYKELDEDDGLFINYLLNNIETFTYTYKCQENKYLNLKILKSTSNNLKNNLIITNEINIIRNECNYSNKQINKIITNYLKDNLLKFTNKNIKINNTIRGNYENK